MAETETVGRLFSGKTVGRCPVALDAWGFKTTNREVAATLAGLFHAPVTEPESNAEGTLALETAAESIGVILSGRSAVRVEYHLWMGGRLCHHCDGVAFLSPEDKQGTGCGCPAEFSDRKAAARDFRGPKPSITVHFRLADAPGLGLFGLQTGSWKSLEHLAHHDVALGAADEAIADLRLRRFDYTTALGRPVYVRAPVLECIRPYLAAPAG